MAFSKKVVGGNNAVQGGVKGGVKPAMTHPAPTQMMKGTGPHATAAPTAKEGGAATGLHGRRAAAMRRAGMAGAK